MHHLSIKYNKTTDLNELWHSFYDFLGLLRHSGQLLGRDMNPYVHNGVMNAVIVTIAEDAFDVKYQNKYVKSRIKSLEKLCGHPLQIKWVGTGEDQENSICTCKKHEHLLLRYADAYSPIQCGKCYKSIPLYKLKKVKDFGYEPITSWMSNYMACVILDVNCSVGEKWAMAQQTEFDSELSILGRDTAAQIQAATGIKCYYFLNNFLEQSRYKDLNRPCPCCKKPWKLNEEIHKYVLFKCDDCLLMSNVSYNVAEISLPLIFPEVEKVLSTFNDRALADKICSLIETWENFARSYVYKEEYIYEWQNDMDARRLLDESFSLISISLKKSILKLIKPLDDFVMENTFEIEKCIWGEKVEKENKYNRKKHWYYYRVNQLVFDKMKLEDKKVTKYFS
jgi:predicted  nucleic acid-binding Zn ribbon protein